MWQHPELAAETECRLHQPVWGMICVREIGHKGRHYGVNATGTHEGYWGEGVVHVTMNQTAV